jgi:hypothetical protein
MVTYHRRYALVAALGMATGEDDDGAGAKPRIEPVGPSPEAVECAALLDEVPDDVGAEIQGRLEAKAAVPMLIALEQEGWRNWLTQAIEHHRKSLGGES